MKDSPKKALLFALKAPFCPMNKNFKTKAPKIKSDILKRTFLPPKPLF